MFSSLHNHCTFCDGKNSAQEMIEAAARAGFTDFGMSCHCHDERFSLSMQDEEGYIRTMHALCAAYAGKIRVYCGIEQDPMGSIRYPEAYDYVVGSVHAVRAPNGRIYSVDNNVQEMDEALRAFGGDGMGLVRAYYALVTENVRKTKPDIIGHFDLILKLNKDNRYFAENAQAYRQTALEALEQCAAQGGVFEVNTGGMYRGYRDFPYLQDFLLVRLRELGARVTVSTDCHDVNGIDYGVGRALAQIRDAGFETLAVWHDGGFVQIPLEELMH